MHPIATMCRALGVSPAGYYAHIKRPPSARARTDAELSARIAAIHQRSRATYGAPRIHAELAAEGIRGGRKRVARLRANAGLAGASRRQWITTTARDRDSRPAPDLVERNFAAPAPNCLWVAGITYRSFKTQAEARMAVFDFIEGWYNPRRRHSALGYLSPLEYERVHRDRPEQAAGSATALRTAWPPKDSASGAVRGAAVKDQKRLNR
jgi:transposase InsO family protein